MLRWTWVSCNYRRIYVDLFNCFQQITSYTFKKGITCRNAVVTALFQFLKQAYCGLLHLKTCWKNFQYRPGIFTRSFFPHQAWFSILFQLDCIYRVRGMMSNTNPRRPKLNHCFLNALTVHRTFRSQDGTNFPIHELHAFDDMGYSNKQNERTTRLGLAFAAAVEI